MSNPDFTQEVLDYLDTNWDTNNYDPKPTLIDGDEMRDNSDDSRARSVDVANTNVITVDSSPPVTNELIGTEFDFRVRAGVGVSIEALHQDFGGQVADKDEFNSLVTEARRAILAEREYPVSEFTHLTIEQENDESAAESHDNADYFRYLFDVWFQGFETLP